jgi:hypothetical protein
MLARLALLLFFCVGCKGVARLDVAQLNPYRPSPVACGELEGLPGRPLLAITRKQCLAAAFANGRINGENFHARLGAEFNQIPGSTGGLDRTRTPTGIEPAMELLRQTEEMVATVDRDYWALRTAYAVYLCKAAAADTARELESIAEKLVAAGRQTKADQEKATQSRITYDMERETALHGDNGLLDCETRLRHTIGFTDSVPGLLLPADPLPTLDNTMDCAARLEYARDHKLELITARYRILSASGMVDAAKPKDVEYEKQKVELAKQYYAHWEQRTAMDLQVALDRVTAASKAGALVAERRASVVRQLADFEKLANEDAFNRADLIEARVRVALATAEEHQALSNYLSALSDLDRVTGMLLTRDGVKLPSPRWASVPRPRLSEEPPTPTVNAPLGVVRPQLQVLSTADPFAPLPAWLGRLTK